MFDYSNREEFIQPLLQRISILKILDSDLEDLLREDSSNDLPFQQFLLNLREIRQKIRYNDAENCDKEIFKTMKSTFRCCSIMNVSIILIQFRPLFLVFFFSRRILISTNFKQSPYKILLKK